MVADFKDRFSVGLAVIDGLWFTGCLRSGTGCWKALIVFTRSALHQSVNGFCPLGKKQSRAVVPV